jgi:hypothetical protein
MAGTNTLLDTGTVAIPVASGGTGNASATAYAVQCGGTTSTGALQSIASVGTSGQVLTSNGAGALPTFQNASGGGLTWNAVATGSVTLANGNAYWTNNGASLVTYTLPTTAAQFTIIQVQGNSAGGWRIAQSAGQSVVAGNLTTTVGTGGRLDFSDATSGVTLLCTVANTTWQIIAGNGNYTVT